METLHKVQLLTSLNQNSSDSSFVYTGYTYYTPQSKTTEKAHLLTPQHTPQSQFLRKTPVHIILADCQYKTPFLTNTNKNCTHTTQIMFSQTSVFIESSRLNRKLNQISQLWTFIGNWLLVPYSHSQPGLV